MECEFCKKIFANISSLNNHKKTAKYCLVLQDKLNVKEFMCEPCNKIFTTKHRLNTHKESCNKVKIEEINDNYKEINLILEEKNKELLLLKEELIKVNIINIHYEKKETDFKEQIFSSSELSRIVQRSSSLYNKCLIIALCKYS